MNKKWVVTNFENDISWIDNYTDNYLIYDKSQKYSESDKIKHQKNVGYNIYDICYFITNNYENLPDVCVFIKSNVFKHCNKEKFKKIINNDILTPIEGYEHIPESNAHIKGEVGGYMEINNSWYISAHISTYGSVVNRYFQSYNQFLQTVFINPIYPQWIRFAPGAQYIVPKNNILFYSKGFYEKLKSYVDYHQIPSEAHIIERALFTIWKNIYAER